MPSVGWNNHMGQPVTRANDRKIANDVSGTQSKLCKRSKVGWLDFAQI